VHHQPPDHALRVKTAFLVVHARSAGPVDDALISALHDAGVPSKLLQDALVRATGMSKRDAYARIVDRS
jgi:hypothetical protein